MIAFNLLREKRFPGLRFRGSSWLFCGRASDLCLFCRTGLTAFAERAASGALVDGVGSFFDSIVSPQFDFFCRMNEKEVDTVVVNLALLVAFVSTFLFFSKS